MVDKHPETALVVGVGPGLGSALVRCFSAAGMSVAIAARSADKLQGLVRGSGDGSPGEVRAYDCDATDEEQVKLLFAEVTGALGPPALVVYNAGAYMRGEVVDIEADDFERCWRVGCFGGFLVGREAARSMLSARHGSIVFTGATAALRGGAGFANLAVGKFGLRALAQSMARELGPKGIHVAHVIIDGMIASERHAAMAQERPENALLEPEAIADAYLMLHRQHPSAWSLELDLRPWVERF
jgi:NAD(P)-dependent dehydrogenase (short-subunit alcohol dehydrogenase family)